MVKSGVVGSLGVAWGGAGLGFNAISVQFLYDVSFNFPYRHLLLFKISLIAALICKSSCESCVRGLRRACLMQSAVMKYVLLSLMDMKRCGSYFCMGLGKECMQPVSYMEFGKFVGKRYDEHQVMWFAYTLCAYGFRICGQ